jgi:hypothetical protein
VIVSSRDLIALPEPRDAFLRDLGFDRLIRAMLQAIDLALNFGGKVINHGVLPRPVR